MTKTDIDITRRILYDLSSDMEFINNICLSDDHSFGLLDKKTKVDKIDEIGNFLNLLIKELGYVKTKPDNDQHPIPKDNEQVFLVQHLEIPAHLFEIKILKYTDDKKQMFCQVDNYPDPKLNGTKIWLDVEDFEKNYIIKKLG